MADNSSFNIHPEVASTPRDFLGGAEGGAKNRAGGVSR